MKSPYKEFALKFLPDQIRYLLIGESPPFAPYGKSLRYFYNYNNCGNGQILLSTVAYVFLKDKFYTGTNDKKQFLERLAKKGIFLLDATYDPINQIKDKEQRRSKIEKDYPELKDNIRSLQLRGNAEILLIHRNVIKVIGQRLREDFRNFSFYDIGFPRYYNDEKFKEKIVAAIKGKPAGT
jgi:hypothetical protein